MYKARVHAVHTAYGASAVEFSRVGTDEIRSVNDGHGAVQGRGVAVVHKLSVRHPLSFSQRSSVTVYRPRPPRACMSPCPAAAAPCDARSPVWPVW
jgi:hypothetical protein